MNELDQTFILKGCGGIKSLNSKNEIGVSVIKVYAQIAKFESNPLREKELTILRTAIKKANGKMHVNSRYAIMNVGDAFFCFGEDLYNFPKTAILLSMTSK